MKSIETTVTYTELLADEGKVFKRKEDDTVLGNHIVLGKDDNPDNYAEVTDDEKSS